MCGVHGTLGQAAAKLVVVVVKYELARLQLMRKTVERRAQEPHHNSKIVAQEHVRQVRADIWTAK